jgi:hypothetical protein
MRYSPGTAGFAEVTPTQLVPVHISDVAAEHKPVRQYSGAIQIEVGRVRVRVEERSMREACA